MGQCNNALVKKRSAHIRDAMSRWIFHFNKEAYTKKARPAPERAPSSAGCAAMKGLGENKKNEALFLVPWCLILAALYSIINSY